MKRTRSIVRALGTLALTTSALSGLHATLPSSVQDASIDDVIDREMPASGAPGLAYAVTDDGRITTSGARGVAKMGKDTPVTPDTPFTIGSISKSFTALAIMQLVESGNIDLDTELAHYLDDFSGRPSGSITIRQLLSHTSGFSTLQGNASHTDSTGGSEELAHAVKQLATVTPAHAPNERWEYSNANYQILGRLIEVVSGSDYQTYVATHILEPLRMNHSFVADGDIHDSMATAHVPWFGAKLPLPTTRTDRLTAPQGGVIASADDLAVYLRMMMNGEDDVLSAEGKALMMSPASETSPYYGLGWKLDPGTGAVWHDGASPGVETLATMIPSDKKAVVVLVNGGSGMGLGETAALRVGITDVALGFDDQADGAAWSRVALFLGVAILPLLYLLSMVWAWARRGKIRAKAVSGFSGLFSLWFPLITTLVAAWIFLGLVPNLNGAPLGTWFLFQPDAALAFTASGVMGVVWSVFRLGVAYTGKPRPV